MEKTHMRGAKESHNLKVKLSAHSQVAKSLTKQNCFSMHHFPTKALPHCTRCSQASLYGMRYPQQSDLNDWLTRVDPRTSTRRLELVTTIVTWLIADHQLSQ